MNRTDSRIRMFPSYDEIETLLHRWERLHPRFLKLSSYGPTAGGRSIFAVRITDGRVDDADKEHVLLTALHAGIERSAVTTALCIMEWLLSGSRQARDTLRRQIIVCVPVADPDAYVEGRFGDPYRGWSIEGPVPRSAGSDRIEAKIIHRLMDEYRPELHADMHGLSLEFEGYIMAESSGASYSNAALRPYHSEVMKLMDEAALKCGYPSDKVEGDAERLLWGPGLDAMGHHTWRGRPRIYAAIYCYNRYHTLLSVSEVGWEESGTARHRALFSIGNGRYPGEYYRGYPVRVIESGNHAMVTAYGTTAAERRDSRVELWNAPNIACGIVDPVIEGKLVAVCATTAAARQRWLAEKPLAETVQGLSDHPRMNTSSLQRFVSDWPAGQNRPFPFIPLHGGKRPGEDEPIRHGLSLRLRIPYKETRMDELFVNGYPVAESERDGFLLWHARGYTYLQIAIPPKRSQAEDLFIVTCAYRPKRRRTHWRGWMTHER